MKPRNEAEPVLHIGRKRVSFHTLGCKLNAAETATMGRQFVGEGYTVVPFGEPSDVVVLNSCSVTERADRECRQLVRRVRRATPNAVVAVVGCYAQLRPYEIASIPGVDLVAGSTEKFNILPHVVRSGGTGPATVLVASFPAQSTAIPSHSSGLDRTRAFLKVQDGCDYSCSFCTIPLARGPSRSVPFGNVISDARTLLAEGFREIVLTGVNTGDYGRSTGGSLLLLLRELCGLEDLARLRVSSVEPNLLDDSLLDFWLAEPKMCKHWHLPLQSGSDDVLKRMRRRYRTSLYANRIETIKNACPDAGIGADVITGFPGETEAQFETGYSFIRDLPLSYLHVFTYSERANTDAATLPDRVEPRVRAMRSERLRQLGARKRRLFHESFVGREVDVLFESRDEFGRLMGLTSEYLRVAVGNDSLEANTLATVLVEAAGDESCDGSVVRDPSTSVWFSQE